jgi:inosine-uridine nucleoside N-ribohydrolase
VPIKIIIDTDVGENIDDLLAVAFALTSPEFEIVAITTVNGDTPARSRIARRTTATFRKPHTPVAAGYVDSMPHGDQGIVPESSVTQGALAPNEADLPPPSPLRADELIAQLAAEQPGEIWLLTIGAMTNVGHAFVRYPETALNLRGVVSCGGRFATPPVAIGWNLRYDPIAAAVTACSGVDWTLLSEGMMDDAALREEDVERIKDAGLPTTDLLARAMELWKKNKRDATPTPRLNDLSVLFYLMNEEWIPVRRGRAIIAISPDRIAELWIEHDPAGPHTLGRSLDNQRAEWLRALFMERILSAAAG